MPNIFTNRDENELVQKRDVKPAKSPPQPKGEASQPKPDKASQPSNSPVTPQEPEQPQAQQPLQPDFYQAPIPFAPPIGYDAVQSSANAFDYQREAIQQLQTPQAQDYSGFTNLFQHGTPTNPGIKSLDQVMPDIITKSQEWVNDFEGRTRSYWDNYVTHTTVGVNPATQFDAAGNPLKTATETDIRTGLNGLMSDLGKSLQQNFDQGNWWSSSIRTMKGLVPMVANVVLNPAVRNVLSMLPGIGTMVNMAEAGAAVIEPGAQLANKILFANDPEFVKNNAEAIRANNRKMYAQLTGDLAGVEAANKILQNNPVKPMKSDYGDGVMGTIFYALNTPFQLLTAAPIYEYADGWRQWADNRDRRTFGGNVVAAIQAATATIQTLEPEMDKTQNRFVQVLAGKDLSFFNKWTPEKYLSLQEPAGLQMGTKAGNLWWDFPELITEKMGVDTNTFGGYMTLAMLHNIQGMTAFGLDMVVDTPVDRMVQFVQTLGKVDNMKDVLGKVDDIPFIQTYRERARIMPEQFALPASDGSRYVTIDVEARPVTTDFGTPANPWNDFEVVADPWDITPNPNKAQTHLVNLDSTTPQLIPSVDLDFVYRSNDDIARLANRMGIKIEPTDAEVNNLIKLEPTLFARYGKPVHPELENFNSLATPGGAIVPISQTYPVELRPLPDTLPVPDQLDQLFEASKTLDSAATAIIDSLNMGKDPSSAIVLYKKADADYNVAKQELPSGVAYTENVYKLPEELHTTAPQAEGAGAGYIDALKQADYTITVAKQLQQNYDELLVVEELIDTKLNALPDVGLEDMHNVQAVMGQNGLDDMMDLPIAKDVPEPVDLVTKFQDDPVIIDLENQVKELTESWAKESKALEKKLIKEYKKSGLDPVDALDDPEFMTAQAKYLYKNDILEYQQMKREKELLGAVDPVSLNNFLSTVEDTLKEYGQYLPPGLRESWTNTVAEVKSWKATPKPVSPEQQLGTQIYNAPKSGDMTMQGDADLNAAWRQGNAEFDKLAEAQKAWDDYWGGMDDATKAKVEEALQKGDDWAEENLTPEEFSLYFEVPMKPEEAVKFQETLQQASQPKPEDDFYAKLGLDEGFWKSFEPSEPSPISSVAQLEAEANQAIKEGMYPLDLLGKLGVDTSDINLLDEKKSPEGFISKAEYQELYGSDLADDLPFIIQELTDQLTPSAFKYQPTGIDFIGENVHAKHKELADLAYKNPELPDPSLQVFQPGEAVQSYTMGTFATNQVGWDAALHRDLIMMRPKEFANLDRQVPKDVGVMYYQWYNNGWLKVGGELPHARAMSFTNMDIPGAHEFTHPKYGGGNVVIKGTKVPGVDVREVSMYPSENEVVVPKFVKLVIDKVEETESGLTIFVRQQIEDLPASVDTVIRRRMEKGGALVVWQHGTNVNDDIRRFIPENGSGTHELGMGLYLTTDPAVAEASAKKFRYENVPVNLNYEVGTPSVREVDITQIRTVINLNDMITKKRFMELFGDALSHHKPADVQDFYRFWRDNSDLTIGSVYDTYRLWQAQFGIDELKIRVFHQKAFNTFSQKYEAGFYMGKLGGTLVVYKPERLVNKGYREVAFTGDATLEALESRRFLDHVAEQNVPSDVRKVLRLQSTQDVIQYQKQKLSESLAEQLKENARATKELIDNEAELRKAADEAKQEGLVKYDPVREAERATDEAALPTGVEELTKSNKEFRKFRNKIEQKLQRAYDRLDNLTNKARPNQAKIDETLREIDTISKQIDNVYTAVNHYYDVFRSISAKPVGREWMNLIDTTKRQVINAGLDADWWTNRGEYAWGKTMDKLINSVNKFISHYISNYMGGVIGKIDQQLFDLRRVGSGRFQMLLAQREASQRVSRVQKEVRELLKPYKLSDNDFAELFHDLAELQASPYIMDEAFANTNVHAYLSNKLNTQYSKYIDMGIPEDVLEVAAERVREIPQVYAEVKQLANELGITFGDEVTLGYIPRQKKRTTEFYMETAHKGEADSSDFMKSRKNFHWITEDSNVLETILNTSRPGWKKALGVEHFDELIGDDGKLLASLVAYLDDDVLDMLNKTGIMRKIPFTASESAKFLAEKYQLPLRGLTDVFITDPKRALEYYVKGLSDRAGKNLTAYQLTQIGDFTKRLEDMDDAAREVFTVPFIDALPDTLKSSLPENFESFVKDLYVHPLVADELRAMYFVSTNAGLLGQVGDVLNLIYKASSGMMLSSGRWLAYQLIGNTANLVKRGINPMNFYSFITARVRANDTTPITEFLDKTSKVYGGGTKTQADVYHLAVAYGLVESDATYLGSFGNRPMVPIKDWGKETKRSAAEFFRFMFQTGTHDKDGMTTGKWLTGLSERLISGADTAVDHTFMRYVDWGNKLTDDAFKFSLFESVMRDPGTAPHIPGWRTFSGIPHFTDPKAAAKWVRDNSYMFDETFRGEGSLRYLVPFWTFHRLNLGETARWVSSNPAKFANYLMLVNSLQAGFNEDDSARWEALHSNKWFDNQFTVPFRIPAERSQSGEDEVWIIPSAQIFPSLGALAQMDSLLRMLGAPTIPFDFGQGEAKPSQSPYNEFASKGTWVQREGSPFIKQLLGLLDENYLFDQDLSAGYDLDKDYALGMDKKQWAMFKMWLRPMANLLNALPTPIMGAAPYLSPTTGEYKEGTKSMFTGQLPHYTSANVRNFFGENVMGDTLKNMGLQPMPFDALLTQEYTMGNVEFMVKESEKAMFKVRKELEMTDPGDKAKLERLSQRAQELTLLYVHLRSEYDIYQEWRRLNGIPHPKALKIIRSENLKVSDMLPKAERERIYKENWDKNFRYFTR